MCPEKGNEARRLSSDKNGMFSDATCPHRLSVLLPQATNYATSSSNLNLGHPSSRRSSTRIADAATSTKHFTWW